MSTTKRYLFTVKIKNSIPAYLDCLCGVGLTKEEEIEIDENTQKSREKFSKGFTKSASPSLTARSLYSLATSSAYAEDSNVPATTPTDTEIIQPALQLILSLGLNF